MLKTKEKGILISIVSHCQRIIENINQMDEQTFFEDSNTKDIVCFNILQIGELVKHFDDLFIEEYKAQPWKSIKGMRDRIAHGYGTIVWEKVWQVATNQIVPLKEYCEKILKENN